MILELSLLKKTDSSSWSNSQTAKLPTPKAPGRIDTDFGVYSLLVNFSPHLLGKTASPPKKWNGPLKPRSRIQDETGKRIVTKSRTGSGKGLKVFFSLQRGIKDVVENDDLHWEPTWWCLGACEHWTRRPGHIRETRPENCRDTLRDIQPRLPIWTGCSLISMSSFNLGRWE